MKKSILLLATLTLPIVLTACSQDDDCYGIQYLLGICSTSSGTSGGTGGGNTGGTTGGTGGGNTGGTTGGTGGGNTGGTTGGTGGGNTGGTSGGTGGDSNLQTAPTSGSTSSAVCSTHCNSNDVNCYNIVQCENEKYSASSTTAAGKKDKDN